MHKAFCPTHPVGPEDAGMSRRRFLRQSALALAAVGVPASTASMGLGANGIVAPSDRVTVALIGRGAMGSGHLRRLAGDPGFQVVAVCDVDRTRREEGKATVEQVYAADRNRGGYAGCAAVNDYRELLARSDLDAVLIATPDHWHAVQTIDAVRAGKDVYTEKPVSMTIDEGRRLADAVRRHGRVFQTGTQYRSIPTIRQVCRFVRAGGLGRVRQVFTLLNPVSLWLNQERCKPFAATLTPERWATTYVPVDFALPPEPVPAGLDWNLWVGPAPWREFNQLYHANPSPGVVPWSFDAAFGVTSLTWHLAHSADVIQWALGEEVGGPVEVVHPASGEFPTLTCRYGSGTLLHFVEHWGVVKEAYRAVPADARLEGNFGGLFVGDRGWVTSMTTGGAIEAAPAALFDEMKLASREVNPGGNNHHANWLECIRARTPPSCHEEIGHRSASLGHLVNLACWMGRSLKWDPAAERVTDCEAANRLLARATRMPWRL